MKLLNEFRQQPLRVRLITLFLSLEAILYFLNTDSYLQISGFPYFVIAVCFIGAFGLINRKSLPNTRIILFSLLFILYIFFLSLISGNLDSGYLFSYILLVLLLVFTCMYANRCFDITIVEKSYILGAVIISALQCIFQVRFYALSATRITIQVFGHDKIDPNYLAAFLVVPAILCVKYFLELSGKGRWLPAISFLLIMIGIFIAGSRGAVIAVAAAIGILLISSMKEKITTRKIVMTIIIIASIFILISKYVPQETISRLMGFSDFLTDTSNQRRLLLWENAFETIKQNPIFGYGAAYSGNIIYHATGFLEPAHNTFLDIWLHGGLPGLFYIIYVLLYAMKGKGYYYKAICIATIVMSVFIAVEVCYFLWLNLIICINGTRYENNTARIT